MAEIKKLDEVGIKVLGTYAKNQAAEALTNAKKYTDDEIKKIPKYELPEATAEVLGGVKLGAGLDKDENGKIFVTGDAVSQIDWSGVQNKVNASKEVSGIVRVGDGIDVTDGVISVPAKSFKKINGESIEGTGDITIDLSLYKVVNSLPADDVDENKIYLVASSESIPDGELNVYIEYIYVNNKWEKLGEFKTAVDLTPYATKEYVDGTFVTSSEYNTFKTNTADAISSAKNTAVSEAAAAAAGLYQPKGNYALKSEIPTFVSYTEDEITAILNEI